MGTQEAELGVLLGSTGEWNRGSGLGPRGPCTGFFTCLCLEGRLVSVASQITPSSSTLELVSPQTGGAQREKALALESGQLGFKPGVPFL